MRTIIILFMLFFAACLYGDDFEIQEDSYFSPPRTKIIWSIASGISSGSANGFLGMNNGMAGDAELIRFVGRVKPGHRFFEYIWATFGINYNLYEYDTYMYETISEQLVMGIGIKLSDEGLLKHITPYLGAGGGYGAILERLGLDSDAPQMEAYDGAFYIQTGGIEFKLINTFTLFIEEKYIWGKILASKHNYIPYEYGDDEGRAYTDVPPDRSFSSNKMDLSQVLIKAGIRFYWGQNMFWMYPFFWEK